MVQISLLVTVASVRMMIIIMRIIIMIIVSGIQYVVIQSKSKMKIIPVFKNRNNIERC